MSSDDPIESARQQLLAVRYGCGPYVVPVDVAQFLLDQYDTQHLIIANLEHEIAQLHRIQREWFSALAKLATELVESSKGTT